MNPVNYSFPPEMVQRLKKVKELTGIPMAEFVRRAVEAALKESKIP